MFEYCWQGVRPDGILAGRNVPDRMRKAPGQPGPSQWEGMR